MSALTSFVFRAPHQPTDTWSVVQWWESRRPAYNAAVGTAGLLSLGVVSLLEAVLRGGWTPGIPWAGILVYGVLANVFYSFGPVIDAVVCRRWGRDYAAVGPALFRYGFVFAVGLTLLPIPLAMLSFVVRLALAIG